jgi:hypothetical protein
MRPLSADRPEDPLRAERKALPARGVARNVGILTPLRSMCRWANRYSKDVSAGVHPPKAPQRSGTAMFPIALLVRDGQAEGSGAALVKF